MQAVGNGRYLGDVTVVVTDESQVGDERCEIAPAGERLKIVAERGGVDRVATAFGNRAQHIVWISFSRPNARDPELPTNAAVGFSWCDRASSNRTERQRFRAPLP